MEYKEKVFTGYI